MAAPPVGAPIDANGNLTADGTRTFEWDARNQLVAVTVGTHRSEFTYDGQQRRVRIVEKESGATQSDTNVLWCEMEVCEERTPDGATVTRRILALGEQVGGIARFFAPDHLGNVTEVTDSTSAVLARYAFDPWGRQTVTTGSDVTNVGFTGHRTHASSATYLAPYRAYDASLGRWLSDDPIGFAGGLNFYGYVANNPIRHVDELGLRITCVSSVRQERVTRTRGGTAGWTYFTTDINALDCERDKCTNTWKFDAQIKLNVVKQFAVDPNLPSKETPGSTLGQHEGLHAGDYVAGCGSLNANIKSEGFPNRGACQAARATLRQQVDRLMQRTQNETRRKRDGK